VSAREVRAWIETLAGREPMQGLKPERVWDPSLSKAISALPLPSGEAGDALRSALLLWNDDLDGSHSLSQDIPSATGSLLHGIMHRMEGDYWNAEYWFRRVGAHPCYVGIARAAEPMEGGAAFASGDAWDPYAFVRAVQRAVGRGDEKETAALRLIQRMEMAVVVEYCYQQCFGGTVLD